MSLHTRPMRTTKPRLVVMPDKVLVTDTLIGPISTDEVLVLRHVAHLAAMVTDFDELAYAVRRAQHIQRTDAVLAKTEKSFFHPAADAATTAN
jgi:hypothetical protein